MIITFLFIYLRVIRVRRGGRKMGVGGKDNTSWALTME